MTRYYFHTSDGEYDVDDIGVELADDRAARREAIRYGGDILSNEPDLLSNAHGLRIDVTDDRDAHCFAIVIRVVSDLITA